VWELFHDGNFFNPGLHSDCFFINFKTPTADPLTSGYRVPAEESIPSFSFSQIQRSHFSGAPTSVPLGGMSLLSVNFATNFTKTVRN
jgi:hypothetical protein